MRVVHLSSSLSPIAGGVATALAKMAQAQAKVGLNVSVVSTWVSYSGQEIADQLRQAGVEVQLIKAFDPRSQHPQLRRMMDQTVAQADVVHIHAIWESIQHHGARASQAARKPYVFTPHGMLDPWSLSQSKFKKKLYMMLRLRRDLNGAARLHFTTPTEADGVKPLKLSPPVLVVPNGIDLTEFENPPVRGSFRNRHPELGDRPIVLFLSRINYKKGLDLLIPAFAQLSNRQAMLVIAGPDSDCYQAKVQQMIQEHGIADRVIFTGMLHGQERIEALVDADLFCLPSYQENFGIVVAEAMACGLPVIVSDQVSLHPDVSAAGAGAVINLDIGALAGELSKWLNDQPLRCLAGEQGRSWALRHYDSARIALDWAGHYETILNESSNRGR